MIFTNKETYRTAQRVVQEHQLGYPVYFTEMKNAVALAREKLRQGTEIIISRGGVASHIQSVLSIPVVSVRYTFSDFATSLETAYKYSHKVAFLSFGQGYEAAQRFRSFLSSDITLVQVKSPEDIPDALTELKQSGIEVLIGGHTTMSMAQKSGFHCVPMQANPFSILDAVEDAEHILTSLYEKKAKVQTISAVLDCCTTAVIALSPNGIITNINALAQQLLQRPQLEIIGHSYQEFLGELPVVQNALRGEASYRKLITYQQETLAVNCVPIMIGNQNIGVVINLQGGSEIQALENKIRRKTTASGYVAKCHFEDIIGNSPALLNAKQKARTYALVDSTVMIYGESGTGKELFAQSIHNSSLRRANPFVAINCAALPENLLESELFGYVKGAFTGARNEGKPGIFELAHNGTIFLDEIGEMTPNLQARLLRVIQEKEMMRLGDDKVIPINVRILAATNRNLWEEVERGNFRADLYYRLCVLVLRLPALRQRKEDIAPLCRHFVRQYSFQYSRNIREVREDAISLLKELPFYGNIREFSNLIERAVVLCNGPVIGASEIMQAQSEDFSSEKAEVKPLQASPGLLRTQEMEIIRRTLEKNKGNRTETARELGMSRSTLWRKLQEYRLEI